MQPIVSISGIRGILGESLTPEIINKYILSFVHYTNAKRIVIGRDGRLCSDLLANLIISILTLSGCEVIYLGIAPTPTIALAVRNLKTSGGVSITASHNSQKWNGMKFINHRGLFLNNKEIEYLSQLPEIKKATYVNIEDVKPIEHYPSFYNFHISKILHSKLIAVSKIKRRKFKVVLDCVNSSGSFIIPKLLEKLGCKVIKADCDGSGVFSRNPEPLPKNLIRTGMLVKEFKTDLGIVVDPDADRLAILDERGKPFGEEYTITAAINYVFKHIKKNKRIAVVNLSTTKAVNDIVKKFKGGKLYRSPVGEINVIKKMVEHKAVIGGEGSGGVILPSINFCRDALTGIGLILSEIAESGMSISEYKKNLPEYYMVKEKIKASRKMDMSKLSLKLRKYKQDRQDGIRIDFNNSWINFRLSNTEPIVRIIAEAKTKKIARGLIKKFKTKLLYSHE